MRGVFLVLLLLPSPAAALLLEYELAVFAENLCMPAGEHLACQRGVSTLLDDTGEPFADLLGEITLDTTKGKLTLTEFSIFGRPTGLTLLPLPFSADLDRPTDIGGTAQLEVATSFRGVDTARTLTFDSQDLLEDLERLEFVARMNPGISVSGCLIETAGGTTFVESRLVCRNAAEAGEVVGFGVERELLGLHIVAVPVPEPAAILLLGMGAALAAMGRLSS